MIVKSYFPSQVVSDVEKISYDYGLKVAKAIEAEWFYTDRGSNRYRTNHNNFHNLETNQYCPLAYIDYDQ